MGYFKCFAPPPFFEELLCLLLGENHVDKSCCTTLAATQNRYYSRCSYGLFGMELIFAHCFLIHFYKHNVKTYRFVLVKILV